VVALGGQEDLGLVGEAAESLAVDDPVPVLLECGPQGVIGLGPVPAFGLGRQAGAFGEIGPFRDFDAFSHVHQSEGSTGL
jgi:hypothetical protein